MSLKKLQEQSGVEPDGIFGNLPEKITLISNTHMRDGHGTILLLRPISIGGIQCMVTKQVQFNTNIMKKVLFLLLLPLQVFSQCILNDNVTVNPPPIGGVYQPGQTITFTYTITAYQGLSVNWMHGIAVALGGGWDATSLAPVGIPTNNTGTGVWLWVNSITSSATGNTVNNPGWFYDTNSGGALDGNPGNNWGDGLTGPWTFQFQVTVGDCPPNQNGDALSLVIENYADGETGSWINYDCQDDANESFSATIECCPAVLTGAITHN